MRNSKFAEAYLNIIKEENEQFAMSAAPEAPVAPVPTEAGTEESGEGDQIVCFKTSDKGLIDAINSGFEEAVFFVKAWQHKRDQKISGHRNDKCVPSKLNKLLHQIHQYLILSVHQIMQCILRIHRCPMALYTYFRTDLFDRIGEFLTKVSPFDPCKEIVAGSITKE